MKKRFCTIALVAVGAGLLAFGLYAGGQKDDAGKDALLLENVEALARNDVGSNGEIPRYVNETEIKEHKDVKVEIDSSGLRIEYSRTCSDVITYCDHTGNDDDICYESLNGVETTCGDWSN